MARSHRDDITATPLSRKSELETRVIDRIGMPYRLPPELCGNDGAARLAEDI